MNAPPKIIPDTAAEAFEFAREDYERTNKSGLAQYPELRALFYVDPDEREDHGESFGELYAALVRGPL